MGFLRRAGLVGAEETAAMEPLTGGVSSDIWKVDTATGPICVKRALPTLKTEKEWHAPVERNANEADWIRTAARIVPDAVPEILAEDRDAGMFAMTYLSPAQNPVWKAQLRDGTVHTDFAARRGPGAGKKSTPPPQTIQRSQSASRPTTFSHAIRIEPYLLRTAETCPDVADNLRQLARTTADTRRVLVHGDISPKNILAGPAGPVFLDAECAWFGDPAFDLAFCLNHLLLKCIWRPANTNRYLESYAPCLLPIWLTYRGKFRRRWRNEPPPCCLGFCSPA